MEFKKIVITKTGGKLMTKEKVEGEQEVHIRPLNKDKYGISKFRFMEVYYFCLQYHEWKDELQYNTDTVQAIQYDKDPIKFGISDQTGDLGARRAELSKRCDLIEQTAIEADPDIYQYIIKAVTNVGIGYNYLYAVMGIPCSRNTYYRKRRRFYWLLSKKI